MNKTFTIDPDLMATPGQRLANYLLDAVLQALMAYGILIVIMAVEMVMGYNLDQIQQNLLRVSDLGQYSFMLVIMLVYYNFWEILFARTVGKFATKTIVVDIYGEKPTANPILLRSICRAIPFEFLTFLGMPCRGWHDSFSDTYVVQKDLLDQKKKSFRVQQQASVQS